MSACPKSKAGSAGGNDQHGGQKKGSAAASEQQQRLANPPHMGLDTAIQISSIKKVTSINHPDGGQRGAGGGTVAPHKGVAMLTVDNKKSSALRWVGNMYGRSIDRFD